MNANDQREKNQAAKLLELLDSKFKLSTMYMADLTYILSILCKTFRKDNISLSEVKYPLDIAVAAITTQFVGTTYIRNKSSKYNKKIHFIVNIYQRILLILQKH
jgi:hypothetical protein